MKRQAIHVGSRQMIVLHFAALVAVGCVPGDDPSAGGHTKHPQPLASAIPLVIDAGSDANGLALNVEFSAIDKAIADDCLPLPDGARILAHAWSKNVPDVDCTQDTECGDGFCDREHCAAISTCGERYGQRCIHGNTVKTFIDPRSGQAVAYRCNGLCIDGRCRSCRSDAECEQEEGPGWVCNKAQEQLGGRRCARIWTTHPIPPR